MKRILALSLALFLCLFMLAGCSPAPTELPDSTTEPEQSVQEPPVAEDLGYEQITPEKAKAIMDSGEPHVILDVRTQDEFETGHIEGAVLLPDYEIAEKAESVLPDKDALILVYCRSGRRSKEASAQLVQLGYTNVKEFGGIIDWPYAVAMQATCGGA